MRHYSELFTAMWLCRLVSSHDVSNSLGGIHIIGIEDKTWGIVSVKSTSETIDGLLQNKFLELLSSTESQELLMPYQDVFL